MLAANQHDANAQHNLGVMYEHGQGVEQNKEEAKKWYQRACENGNEEACATLSQM